MLSPFISVMICMWVGINAQNFDTIIVCRNNITKNINKGTFDPRTKSMTFEEVVYPVNMYYKVGSDVFGCVCNVSLCLNRCCDAGQHLVNDTCVPADEDKVSVDVHDDYLQLVQANASHTPMFGWTHCSGYMISSEEGYFISREGTLRLADDDQLLETHHFCIGYYNDLEDMGVHICADEFDDDNEANIYGMLVSIPFLFATVLVYLILPNKNLKIKCLLAYMTCLMFSYFSLVYIHFNDSLEECTAIAAAGIYFFMATFFWMNITCIDMYWTFSGRRGFRGMMAQSKFRHWKQFGYYTLFANGSPIILIIIIFALNTYPKHHWFHPGIGEAQCWLKEGKPKLLYFYGPMAVLLFINVCLFIITTITIRKNLIQSQKDFRLYLKLFIAMGINWIMEFISWMVDWLLGESRVPAVWYLTDFCNAFYGVFIFIIFVCKRTIWIKLRQRYYVFVGKPTLARALSSGASNYHTSQSEKTGMDDMSVSNIN